MIEINLLPSELLKNKEKKLGRDILRPEYLFLALPVAACILVTAHLTLFATYLNQRQKLNLLQKKWDNLKPKREALEELKRQYEGLSVDSSLLEQLNIQKINWAEKLNRLSFNLPAGVWFNEINATRKNFFLKGAVISLQKEEMNLINQFIGKLKNDSQFFKDFSNLELIFVERQNLGGYEVTNFTLSGELKLK